MPAREWLVAPVTAWKPSSVTAPLAVVPSASVAGMSIARLVTPVPPRNVIRLPTSSHGPAAGLMFGRQTVICAAPVSAWPASAAARAESTCDWSAATSALMLWTLERSLEEIAIGISAPFTKSVKSISVLGAVA